MSVRRKYLTWDPVDRFWAFTERTPTCWLWHGCITEGGYGVLRVKTVKTKAHRYAYELLRGPIPDGLVIDHVCRVRNCVNPDHLEPVTEGENVRRGISPTAVNRRKTHCIHGHEFTPENTYLEPRGGRQCRSCRYAQQQARRKVPDSARGDG